jgi:hypothetical protein
MPGAQRVKWLTVALFVLPSLAVAASAESTKSAVMEYFAIDDWKPKLERRSNAISLEVCFDICYFYQAKAARDEADLWDLAFLHQYYMLKNVYHVEDFRKRYESVAEQALRSHSGKCTSLSQNLIPTCTVENLGRKLGARYSVVRYDEGYRCQAAGHLTDQSKLGKGVCKSVQGK